MNLISVVNRFPDQHACIEHLESVRWKDEPYCPYCGGAASRGVRRRLVIDPRVDDHFALNMARRDTLQRRHTRKTHARRME